MDKIVESIRFICKKQGKECVFNNCGNCTACPSIGVDLVRLEQAILALIASEQAEHDIEVADVAFDKGFDVGKTEAKIEAEAKYKPMVEALKGIEERARLAKGKATGERPLKSATEACAWIAKEAHAVLPKGEGR